ncbi:MAG TPA: histone deacetylase [Mycobacteriales bacterium]|nr:histone deacetylase [Mycobacteriales bacterium]
MDRQKLVWYVSYGSNLCAARFACYLRGGRPPGATRDYPGCRDTAEPRETVALWLPGGIYFAWDSPVWDGGVAFYDPARPGPAAARGYLITVEQLADVVAQEMHRPPGASLDLAPVFGGGRQVIGPGRYETLLRVGERAGRPLVTFTAPWTAVSAPRRRPSAAYLRMLVSGLAESHGWTGYEAMNYLATQLES